VSHQPTNRPTDPDLIRDSRETVAFVRERAAAWESGTETKPPPGVLTISRPYEKGDGQWACLIGCDSPEWTPVECLAPTAEEATAGTVKFVQQLQDRVHHLNRRTEVEAKLRARRAR
jgi:hypothetical protein